MLILNVLLVVRLCKKVGRKLERSSGVMHVSSGSMH